MPNFRDRTIADMLREMDYRDSRSGWYRDYDDPYSVRYTRPARPAPVVTPVTPWHVEVFRNFDAFVGYCTPRLRTANVSHFSDDFVVCWNIIAYLKSRQVSSSHSMSADYFINLFQRIDYSTATQIISAAMRVFRAFSLNVAPRMTSQGGHVIFEHFHFLNSISAITPVYPGIMLAGFFSPTQNAAPAPVQQDQTRLAPLLPMPTIHPEDLATKEEVARDFEAEKGRLADTKDNLEAYKRHLARYNENKEMIKSLFDFPLKEVNEFLDLTEYRATAYGYDSGAECNCANCRIVMLEGKIHFAKMRVDTLTASETSYTASVETLSKKLEELSIECEKPAIFMPSMEFACEKLLSILCE